MKQFEKLTLEEQEAVREQIRKQNIEDANLNEYELWCREQKSHIKPLKTHNNAPESI